ncbi:MAG TPA: PQQ-binding-like beta-propeller repeat protein [Chloroflexota bacterium]
MRLATLLAVAALFPATTVAQVGQDLRPPPAREWPLVGGHWGNSRYSTLREINTSNVQTLKGAWMARLNGSGVGAQYSQQATPVVKDGVMYIPTGQQDLFALDAKTGQTLWEFYGDVNPRANGIWANRGVALGDGLIFKAQVDAQILALDQKTGKVVWQKVLGDNREQEYLTGAPLYFDGLVYIGISGGDRGARGRLRALDAKTGQEVWNFNTIPGPGEFGHDTWPADNNSWERGGAAVWATPAVDPDLGLIYFNVGNAWPDFDGSKRAGDNLFTGSVLALEAKTGKYRWHFQLIHHEIWDSDAPNPVVLFESTIDGRLRKGVAAVSATGWIFAFDRATGEPIYPVEERPVPQEPRQNTSPTQPFPAGEPVIAQCVAEPPPGYTAGCFYDPFWDVPNRLVPFTGPRWGPMTFSGDTGYFYVTSSISPAAIRRVDDFAGGFITPVGTKKGGLITAVDSRTNRVVWRKETPYPIGFGSGAMSTAGGLVFHGEPDGNFIALDARTGDELWRFQTGFGADAPPMTYEMNGEQYVAIATGGTSLNLSAKGDAVWSFKLTGRLGPLYPPPAPASVQAFSGPIAQTDAIVIGVQLDRGETVPNEYAFAPTRTTVAVGATVTWTNNGQLAHTATEQRGAWDTDLIAPGQSVSLTFNEPGTYAYICAPHPWMMAQLIVQ